MYQIKVRFYLANAQVIEIIDDFYPATLTGQRSSKNTKENTLTGTKLFNANSTHHVPSKNAHTN
jgi:hypothetical protein